MSTQDNFLAKISYAEISEAERSVAEISYHRDDNQYYSKTDMKSGRQAVSCRGEP